MWVSIVIKSLGDVEVVGELYFEIDCCILIWSVNVEEESVFVIEYYFFKSSFKLEILILIR